MKNNFSGVCSVCLCAVVVIFAMNVVAEDNSNTNVPNPAAGTPPANPNPATGQANKSAAQNEADVEDLVVVRGKYYASKEEPTASSGGEVGAIVTESDSLKVLTLDPEYVKRLKALDNKLVSLKGKQNEKEKTLLVYQILDDALPAGENSNPRGL